MYNSLSRLPMGTYKILEYLALSPKAENLWKMIKYNSYDALSKDNLTTGEKLSYVWKTGKQEDYSVFFTNLIEDGIAESKCLLKIYTYLVQPNDNLYTAAVVYSFDWLYGGQMSLVDFNGAPVSRADLFTNIILDTLNGAIVGGVGKMAFSDDISRYMGVNSVIGNSKTFTGVTLKIGVLMGDAGKDDSCER